MSVIRCKDGDGCPCHECTDTDHNTFHPAGGKSALVTCSLGVTCAKLPEKFRDAVAATAAEENEIDAQGM